MSCAHIIGVRLEDVAPFYIRENCREAALSTGMSEHA